MSKKGASSDKNKRGTSQPHKQMLQITLPDFTKTKERIGGNLVMQFAERGRVIAVSGSVDKSKTSTVTDPFGRKLCLCPHGCRTPNDAEYVLRITQPLQAENALGIESQLKWLTHKSATWPVDAERIRDSWKGAFKFAEENLDAGEKGLRPPQMGALHAIAAHWSVSEDAATVVMPTGTGKTETMLAAIAYCRCPRVLVIVPTDALRNQTFKKFSTFGCLRDIGILPPDVPLPRVALIRTGIKKSAEAKALADASNVLVATVSVLSACDSNVLKTLTGCCTHLFVDEAHHVAARTWQQVTQLFQGKPILQFTATPYRNDGQQVDGKIVYDYPLSRAQEAGYFRPIDLVSVEELDDERSDLAIAKAAIERLDEDLNQGKDHLILARTRRIDRAKKVLRIYEKLGKKHHPVLIHSQTKQGERLTSIADLEKRRSRILVCVDMFGEGFDLPQLKIAAMHDIHKSLPITLQFVGRFVRTAEQVGGASVIVNMADPQVDAELQELYSENPDWNALLRRSSEQRITREKCLQEFIQSFSGDLPAQLPLWNLRPGHSTLVYRTKATGWRPGALKHALPKRAEAWDAASPKERIAIAVMAKSEDVRWGRYQNIKDHFWNLVVLYWAEVQNLLFVYASDYKIINPGQIAKAVCGDSITLLNGPHVFRALSGIERPMVRTLGSSKVGSVSFTMYFGADVAAALSHVERAESNLNNLFAWGYEGGERITQGCSQRGGKLWAATGGPILDWKAWCHGIGQKLLNDHLPDVDIVKHFLRPVPMDKRPGQIPVAVEWGERVLREEEDRVYIYLGKDEYRLHQVDIKPVDPSDSGPIVFDIRADGSEARYELRIGGEPACGYHQMSGPSVEIKVGSGVRTPFEQWCERDPVVVSYADGSFSYNQFFVNAPCEASFDQGQLMVQDWTGTNIRVESEGPNRRTDSIQYRVIENLRDDFDVVFNDDDSGEAADIIALRKEGENQVLLRLVHCKFSLEDKPGGRVKDLYELCGQAQKCVKWKHAGLRYLVAHMKKRQQKWESQNKTRFIKGSWGGLRALEKLARYSRILFEVVIVQPGLAREAAGEPILRLLGSTELFLKKTAEAKFLVLCGELPSAGERRGRRKGLETGGEVQPDKRPPGMKSTSF